MHIQASTFRDPVTL